jgi:hypothetical protein
VLLRASAHRADQLADDRQPQPGAVVLGVAVAAVQVEGLLFVAATVSLRAFVPGGPSNQGAASTPVIFTVTPVAASELAQNSGA